VLDGNTGSAKTEILHRLAARGHQVIDLEGLANHRGSLFGAMPGGQPGQKLFEGRLAMALEGIDPTRPLLVEAESSRIGDLNLPRGIWAAITPRRACAGRPGCGPRRLYRPDLCRGRRRPGPRGRHHRQPAPPAPRRADRGLAASDRCRRLGRAVGGADARPLRPAL
jgi:hypothetical protein